MSDLDRRIREARERRRWDQAELVRRLAAAGVSVSQQTVSRWERGRTRPQGKYLDAIVRLLDVAPPGEDVPPRSPRRTESAAPRPALLTRLRFEDLTPEEFESFAADLAAERYPRDRAVRFGAQGHEQDGIDVAVEHADGSITGIQCKREKSFGPAKVKKATAALEIEVRGCQIFLSRVASPGARKEIRNHAGWELWDADDLSRAVRQLPIEKALRIVDTFFPGMREPFLGIPTPGPWSDPTTFYAQLTRDRVFTHRWPLHGQKATLDEVVGSVSSTDNRVTALLGRGGIGKTRLLRDVAARVQEDGTEVRFLAPSAPFSPADAEQLPLGDLLVIIDDAQDCRDLSFSLDRLSHIRPEARVLLALRPYGRTHCLDAARTIGLSPSEVPTFELPDLSVASAEDLARTVLPKGAKQLAAHLGAIGTDCPLVIVVGAGLVRQGELDARELMTSPALAEEILRKFAAITTGDGSTPASELRTTVMRALAVLQPLRSDVESFRAAVEALTGRSYDEVSAELRTLEDSGVVLRRGASLRVVPDLLGDVVLEQAFFDAGGHPTGYVERIRDAVTGPAFDNALRNATRVDWRAGSRRGTRTDVIDPLWTELDSDFKGSGIAGRRQIAETLQEIAPFQPGRTLHLIRWAVDNPTVEGDEAEFWGAGPSYDHVLHELAPALLRACVDGDHLSDAADLLWRLGRTDNRPLNQHPNHPVRLLSTLAEFQQYKPTWVTSAVIDRVTAWLDDADPADTAYSPLEVLRPVLATEGHRQGREGHSVTFTPFAMNPSGVADLRRRVLDLAFRQLGHVDVRYAVRAVGVLGDGLRYPPGGFGRAPSTEEREAWTPLIVDAFGGLRDAVRRERPEPATEVAIRFALHVSYSSTEWQAAADSVRAELSTSVEARLALHLHDGWNQLGRDLEDYDAAERAHRDELQEAAGSLLEWSAESIAELLARRLATDRRAFENRTGFPGPFLRILFSERPDVAAAACDIVAADPDSPLCEAVADAITALSVAEHARATTLLDRLVVCGDPRIDVQLASALTWSRRDVDPTLDRDGKLLLGLAASADRDTRLQLARGGRALARADAGLAARMLLSLNFEDSTEIADEVFGAFTREHGYLNWSDLPDASRSTLLDRLLMAPSLEDHQLMLFLIEHSAADPETVLQLLVDRVERSESEGADYRPLPFRWYRPLHFRAAPNFGGLLRTIRDWVAASPDEWRRAHYGADLFRAVAYDFDDEVLLVLEDGVSTGDPDQVRAVGALLTEAPRSLVWERKDVVIRLLRSAAAISPDLADHVVSGLHAAVMSGIRSGTPGQPFPEDVEQRDRSRLLVQELAYGSVERRFYEALGRSAESSIRRAEQDDEIHRDGRRW